MDPAAIFHRVRFQWFAVAAALTLLLAPPVGCSNDSARCVSSQCAHGSECIDDGSGQGATCHQACTSSSQCGFNSFCNDGQPRSWCVENSTISARQAPGQFGAPCLPTGGEVNNPDCDETDGFACYGTTPTDANAFCTAYGCAVDTDCPGGWWCARVNDAPNLATDTPSYGPTRAVCLPRAYCAPCKLDHDCPAAANGTEQHCAIGVAGSSTAAPGPTAGTSPGTSSDASPDASSGTQGTGYCAPECGTDSNCPLDATCKNWQSLCTPSQGPACQSDEDCAPLGGVVQHCDGLRCTQECGADSDCVAGDGGAQKCQWRGLCAPRAGVCLGSGGFCSPCRSDADCTNGFCVSGAPYSTERFCSVKSTQIPCSTATANPVGCPTHKTTDPWIGNACVTTPSNQCEAFVKLGSASGQVQELPGCWTTNR